MLHLSINFVQSVSLKTKIKIDAAYITVRAYRFKIKEDCVAQINLSWENLMRNNCLY